jgi:hypothetical protein
MMHLLTFRGVLLKPLDQQQDRDGRKIDPEGVRYNLVEEMPLFFDFDYHYPIGKVRIGRDEDGSLVVTGEFFESWASRAIPPLQAAIGIRTEEVIRANQSTVRDSEVFAVSLTRDHADPTQPPIIIEGQNAGLA